MKLRLALTLAPLALSCLNVSAQSMKPGLWEHSFKMKSQNGQIEKSMADMRTRLAAMPPAQRKQMEQMLAKSGVGLGPAGNSIKVCVTPEDAARMDLPQQDGNCKQDITQRSASSVKFKFVCTGNPPTTGEGEATFSGPMAYTSHTVINTVSNGKPERMESSSTGKWLSADCGAIQPFKAAKPVKR